MKPIIKKPFYFIRHAQTDANAQQLMCGGGWDVPLNDTGIEQVNLAKLVVESLKGSIDKIFVSPMQRTQMTARLLNDSLNLPVEHAEGLREWCVGDWEKKPWDDVPNLFVSQEDPPNGETRKAFEKRVVETINQCLHVSEEQRVLFVSHGAVAHILFSYMGLSIPYIKNATLYSLRPQDNLWLLQEVGEQEV